MADIPRSLKCIMEIAHELGGFDVDGVLIAERTLFDTKNEPEALDVLMEVVERKPRFGSLIEVIQFKRLKIAHQNMARQIGFLQAWKIVERLFFRFSKISAGTLLFNEQDALPKQINEPIL